MFKVKTEDNYNAQVYLVNEKTKKVEWGYYTSLGFATEENGKSITPEDLKRALEQSDKYIFFYRGMFVKCIWQIENGKLV